MAEQFITVSIAEEVRNRFLRYMMSVVKGRALPDVRDGLKPVQRRILYSMYHDSNLTFDRKAAKCAKIVGDVMGSYHPHGDGAIYEALVRMSQDWVMRLPLVHGEGNFGSVDGDPPAAYRYTEAKLSRAAEALLTELDQDTIDYTPNFSGTTQEPMVLPAQFPNILVNGSQGIAVGLATNIPPHNLGEVLRACIYLIDNPEATVAQLLDRVKGPDFPLGGKLLVDRATLRKIYEEGRGSLKIQAEWKLEEVGKVRQIVVTSIPYGVVKGDLEEAIGVIIEEKKLPQLLSVSNESNDKDGLRIALEIKPGADPALIMAYLYKHTELQRSFSYNMTAVVPGPDGVTMVPRDGLSLKEILQYFLDFRLITVRRKFEYQVRKLLARIHILQGFAKVFNGLDRAIKLIRNSTGKPDAATKLIEEFELDQEQVNAILDSQLYKIAQMEIQKILDELRDKQQEVARLESLLASEKKLWGVIKQDFEKLLEAEFIARRRTRIASDDDVLEFDEQAYIQKENTNVILTRDGWIKRVGRLATIEGTRVRDGDEVLAVVQATTLDTVVYFADDGTAYTMKVNDVPASSGYGEPITKYFKIADQVKIIAAVGTHPYFTPPDEFSDSDTPPRPHLLVATTAGYVCRLPFRNYRAESTKAGRRYAKLDDGDRVCFVKLITHEESMFLASANGHLLQFPIDQVNILSTVGKGVIGIKLDHDDRCIGGALVQPKQGNTMYRCRIELESGTIHEEIAKETNRLVNRGNKGEKPRARSRFVRVLPDPIQLVSWDEIEAKYDRKP